MQYSLQYFWLTGIWHTHAGCAHLWVAFGSDMWASASEYARRCHCPQGGPHADMRGCAWRDAVCREGRETAA